MREPLKVFITYSRKDNALKDALLEHLRVLEQFRGVKVWTDAEIAPGATWRDEIDRAMATTDVALFLVSASFLASDFINKTELPELLERHTREGVVVVPVILKACTWEHHPAIKRFQVLPRGGDPIAKHTGHRRDLAFKQVAIAIASLAKDRGAKSESPLATPAPEPFVLRFVASPHEVRSGIRAFDQEARSSPERTRSLLRQMSYWVHDLDSGAFGPAKFVGYAGMSLDRYEAARAGQLTGERFDGHLTRTAIERALESPFRPSEKHASDLIRWGEALLGKGAFGSVDQTKWSFVTVGAEILKIPPMTTPAPDIRVKITPVVASSYIGRLFGKEEQFIRVEIQNHSPSNFFFSSLMLASPTGRRILVQSDAIAKKRLAPCKIEAGNAFAVHLPCKLIADALGNATITHAIVTDKIGRTFTSPEHDMTEALGGGAVIKPTS